ncbi:hypothetical protein H4J77_19655 [Pseudomonas sp. 5Ae-yellow]|nr:hypothetical protein [Pseudomonas sp. 5Ae-yellow]
MTNLNGGTLCNAEFGIRHRAAPYRKGQVLHSVFAAAIKIAGANIVTSAIEVTPVVLIKSIPPKEKFSYSFAVVTFPLN